MAGRSHCSTHRLASFLFLAWPKRSRPQASKCEKRPNGRFFCAKMKERLILFENPTVGRAVPFNQFVSAEENVRLFDAIFWAV